MAANVVPEAIMASLCGQFEIASHRACDLPSELSTILANALEHSRINKLRRGHCSHSVCFPPCETARRRKVAGFFVGTQPWTL